jgi:hypothetical protein
MPQRKTQTLIGASKEGGLDVNAEKTVYVDASSPECRAKITTKR